MGSGTGNVAQPDFVALAWEGSKEVRVPDRDCPDVKARLRAALWSSLKHLTSPSLSGSESKTAFSITNSTQRNPTQPNLTI